MDRFSWLEIDGIHYEFHADHIDCHTDVGYSYSCSGSRLEDIEITDISGRTIGFFSADFADGCLSFNPCLPVNESSSVQQDIRIGDGIDSEYKHLGDLPASLDYGTILSEGGEQIPEWDAIDAQFLSTDTMVPLPLSLVMSEDETLDTFFGEPSAVETAGYVDPAVSVSTLDLSSIYLEHGVDVSLMPMLPEQIDPSSIL